MTDEYDSITHPLKNGDPLPTHPHDTTAKKIVSFGPVHDADDGIQLTAGLLRATVAVLIEGGHPLGHLYRYAILTHDGARRIFHTRPNGVTIRVRTEPVE